MEFVKENKELIEMLEEAVDKMDKESIEDLSNDLSTYSRMMINGMLSLDIDEKSKRDLTIVFKNYEYIVRNLYIEYISRLRKRNEKLNSLID